MLKRQVLPVAPGCTGADEGDPDLLLEAAGEAVMEQVPAPDDLLLSPLQEVGVGDAVALLPVDRSEGGQEVPEIVVPPDREGEEVVDVHLGRRGDRPSRPDAPEPAPAVEGRAVDPPRVGDRPFGRRHGGEQREHGLFADRLCLVRLCGEGRPLLQQALLPGDETPEV